MTVNEILTRYNAEDKEIKVDMHEVLGEWEPEVAPFLVMSTKLQEEDALNDYFQWLNRKPLPTELYWIAADESTAPTTLNYTDFDNADRLRKGFRIYNARSQELILVKATPPDAGTFGVGRDLGSATAGAGRMKTGDRLLIMSGGQEEAVTDIDVGMSMNPVPDYNYTEYFEHYAKTSKKAGQIKLYTGSNLRQRNLEDMQTFHRKEIELTCIFGERAKVTGIGGTHYLTLTRGIMRHVEAGGNVWPLADISEFTMLAFDDYLRQIIERCPDRKERVFVGSPLFKARMSNWGMGRLELNQKRTDMFMFEVRRYNGSTGYSCDVIEHPLFTGPYLSYLGFLLEYDKIAWKKLQSTLLEMNVQNRAENYKLDKMSTDGGIRFMTPDRMGMIKKAA